MLTRRYTYSLAAMELTFRLEFQILPGLRSPAGHVQHDHSCQILRADCLEIFDTRTNESRLANPAERWSLGEWLLGQVESSPELAREIQDDCLAAASEAEPPRRFRRVSARWKRAA
jgi:hypothetical protein